MSAGLEYFKKTKKLIDNLYDSEMDNIDYSRIRWLIIWF